MHSEIAIHVAAPPERVYRLARDTTRWAELLPHYGRSRLVEIRPDGTRVVEFVARRPFIGILGLGLPVVWRARTWHEPATRRLRFVHVAGATTGMDVTWRIEPASTDAGARPEAGTDVVIEHDFAPALPGLAAVVDRWFTRPIAGRTLATFRAIAEALPADPGDDGPGEGDRGRDQETS